MEFQKQSMFLAFALALGAASAAHADDRGLPPADEMDKGVDDVNVDVDVDTKGEHKQATVAVDTDNSALKTKASKLGKGLGLGAVKLGMGTGDFTQANPRDITGIGPSWDVRGVFGAHSPVGVEAAYVGSARGIGGLGVDDQAALVSNGAEGDLRLAAPIHAGENVDVRPFAFGGVGWQYMTLWGDGAVDGSRDRGDNIMTIPAGVGLELGVGALNIDVRGTYRHALDSEIFGTGGAGFDDPNALHSYNVSAGLGFEF